VGYSEFCRHVQKGAVVTLAIAGVTGPILINFAHDVATLLSLNIFESELPYSTQFRSASLPNEGHFANFAQNWLPWQRPLRNGKRGPDRAFTNKYLSFDEKNRKDRPSGS